MTEQKSPAVPQSSENPAVFKVLPDGTVLYKTYQDAEQASRQTKSGKPTDDAAKKPAQLKLGETYLADDGQSQPYTLGGLMEFQFTGLIVVMLVLFSLYVICAGIGRLLKSLQRSTARPKTAPEVAPVQSPAASGIHPGLSDQQLVVVLAAAAQEALGGPVRVKRFRPLTAHDLDWAAKGRSDLQQHRLK